MMNSYSFGWKRPVEHPHPRTSYRLNRGLHPALPSSFDLRDLDTPVCNQTSLSSCTGFAWTGAKKFRDKNFLGVANVTASELFIYWNERNLEGSTADDAGAAVADGARVLATLGCPPEEDWPYDVTQFSVRPPAPAYASALERRVPAPLSLNNADLPEIQSALYEKQLVVFGFDAYQSFYDVGPNGVYRPRGERIGGHAVCLVGWYPGWVVVRNSWDKSWGADGYCFLPTHDFTSDMVSDCWTIPNAA